jgi:hypothetical protein
MIEDHVEITLTDGGIGDDDREATGRICRVALFGLADSTDQTPA